MGQHQEAKKNRAVYGVFRERTSLEDAVGALKEFGFRNADISILLPRGETSDVFAHELSTKASVGASSGAVAGAAIGGILGWLVGVGSIIIPGLGVFLAAGPIVSALAGAGMTSALGGLTGGLVGIQIPEYEAQRYEAEVKAGGMLLGVHVDDAYWAQKATAILGTFGADRITEGHQNKGPILDYQTGKTDPHQSSRFVS
jgi:hypothetical protein